MAYNAGRLRSNVIVLRIVHEDTGCCWVPCTTIRAEVTYPSGSNLFSKIGLGVRSVRLKIRVQPDLTLHDALMLGDQHLFLTKITLEPDRIYCIVDAAVIPPVSCCVSRKTVETDSRHNRPTLSQISVYTFPACVTEKYGKLNQQAEPQDTTEMVYVLVTPKTVALRAGEVITMQGESWCVQIGHTLDPYKNEYEIIRKEDT